MTDLFQESLDRYQRVLEQKMLQAYDMGMDLCVSGIAPFRSGIGYGIEMVMLAPGSVPPNSQGWTRYITSQRTPEIEAAVAQARQKIKIEGQAL